MSRKTTEHPFKVNVTSPSLRTLCVGRYKVKIFDALETATAATAATIGNWVQAIRPASLHRAHVKSEELLPQGGAWS